MKKILLLALVPFLSGCGLLFVNGPPSGWQEIQDPDHLEMIRNTQPCTGYARYPLLLLDLVGGSTFVAGAIQGIEGSHDPTRDQLLLTALAIPYLAGAGMNVKKGNDCRAFNARVLELREGRTSSRASYEWLDEIFPLPDLGVTGLDPVFGVPVNQDH